MKINCFIYLSAQTITRWPQVTSLVLVVERQVCNVHLCLCLLLQYVDKTLIPKAECLKDTVARALPFWYDQIVPAILVRHSTALCVGWMSI